MIQHPAVDDEWYWFHSIAAGHGERRTVALIDAAASLETAQWASSVTRCGSLSSGALAR
jgi:hypothetical protein